MEAKEIDFAKLNEAVEKFGSLQKANAQLETDKLALEKKSTQLKQDNQKLTVTSNKLVGQIEDLNAKVNDYQSQLQSLSNQIEVHSYQYELVCGLMAMVAESPSVTDSLDTLIASFQKLKEPGWYLSKNADDIRSLFVRTVMGDYLKCFRCGSCGAQFIVNKEVAKKYYSRYYQCPVCHLSLMVTADDSFLKAMLSEKPIENVYRTEELIKENEVLKPLKPFLDVTCEICGNLIQEWTENNVEIATEGLGWAHNQCWNSELGQLRFIGRAVQKIQKARG